MEDTNEFGPSYNHEGEDLNDSAMFGLIIGFVVFGGFLLFSIIMLIRDAINRSKYYNDLVESRKLTLRNTYNCSQADIDSFVKEFEEAGKKKAVSEQDDAISMVN